MSADETYTRPKRRIFLKLSLFALIAAGAGAFGAVNISRSDLLGAKSGDDTLKSEQAVTRVEWLAAAPGRIEPKSGTVRVGSALLGRIAEVAVKQNDKVEEGELLIRLDDDEARARLQAAETEVASRKRERDAQPLAQAVDRPQCADQPARGHQARLELVEIDRLPQEIVAAPADAREEARLIVEGGHQDHVGRVLAALQGPAEVQAGHPGHAPVGEDDLRRLLVQLAQRLGGAPLVRPGQLGQRQVQGGAGGSVRARQPGRGGISEVGEFLLLQLPNDHAQLTN